MDVPQALRVERPQWINVRTFLGLLLFTTALFGGQRALTSAQATTGVWVAAADLPADTVIGPEHLRVGQVALPADVEAGYISRERSLLGSVVNRPVFAGELIGIAAVRLDGTSAIEGRSMTIPASPAHAVGGTLRPGERVDVYVTFGAGQESARTELLLAGAEVLDVVSDGSMGFGDATLVGLTVSVTADEAADVAFAIRNGEIDVVRVAGGPPSAAEARTRDERS